jgi:uncharacterized protein
MKFLRFLIFLLIASPVVAQNNGIPIRPDPPKLVNNLSSEFPDFISASEQDALENKLEKFSNETSNQIVVVIVDDLGDHDINSFATGIGTGWGVGQKKFDNGIVLVIKPTGGEGQRDAYIAVGSGLEGAIPDITAKHIVDDELLERFQNGKNYEGINAATDVIIKLAKGEINSKDYDAQHGFGSKTKFIVFGFLLILILFFIMSRIGGGGFGGGMATGFFIGSGGWGRGGGGFGGGGFGGFGGGGFGGGGGGGKW